MYQLYMFKNSEERALTSQYSATGTTNSNLEVSNIIIYISMSMDSQLWASAGCLNRPSFFRAKACHTIDLEKSLHKNILCSLGFKGKYLNTFAGTLYSFELSLFSAEVFLLSTTFQREVPQVLQDSNFSFSAQNNIQSFGQAWIFW